MTQRIQHPVPLPESHRVSREPSRTTTPGGAMDRASGWGFMTISVLAIGAAGVIARGEVADAELRFTTVAVKTAAALQDICSANGD